MKKSDNEADITMADFTRHQQFPLNVPKADILHILVVEFGNLCTFDLGLLIAL